MSALTKLIERLVKEYGPEVVDTARRILGNEAEPARVEQVVKRLAPKAKPTPAPQKPRALPAPAGYKHPVREGWSVHDRGEHASPLARFQVVRPGGETGRTPAGSESDAWQIASWAANPSDIFKPRGGQWFPDAEAAPAVGMGGRHELRNASPDMVARRAGDFLSEDDPLRAWWLKAVPKYLRNDAGTETDPLRELAARNLLHIPDISPEQWTRLVKGSLAEDPIGHFTVPPHAGDTHPFWGGPAAQEALRESAPWLFKQPVTDSLYGYDKWAHASLDLDHVADEMKNALDPQSGFPPELALRPESLQRMSFPQAVERVGLINQWRVKRMEDENLAAMMNNPAIHEFKEYPEQGMRWVELKAPGEGSNYSVEDLADALKREGDTMGHCVGGYCDDVTSGRSRIFSLRDAKGNPHVTVETAPRGPYDTPDGFGNYMNTLRLGVWDDIVGHPDFLSLGAHGTVEKHFPDLWGQLTSRPDDIVQIKGKQNRAPIDTYLPYVQDFVKSGTWGNVGDLGHAGLTQLPDGRYITRDQWREGMSKHLRDMNPEWKDDWLQTQLDRNYPYVEQNPHTIRDRWDFLAPFFEGYALGGRVSADRCFTRSNLAVR